MDEALEMPSDNEDVQEDREPNSKVEIFQSSHLKKSKIFTNGHTYTLNRELKERFYWRCDLYYDMMCTARLVTVKESQSEHRIVKKSPHNHAPSPHHVLVEKIKNKIRDEASRDVSGTPANIVDRVNCSNLVTQHQISSFLSSENAQREMVRRVKRKVSKNKFPVSPTSLHFDYQAEFEEFYKNGECILLNDSVSQDGTKRFSIFTSEILFEHFCNSELLVADGTFKTCPKPFYQLFIIHGNIPGYDSYFTHPLIWIFLSGKDADLYSAALNVLRQHALEKNLIIRAQYCLCDFEVAIRKSFEFVFIGIKLYACFFHLRQIIIARLKKMKLFHLYESDEVFMKEITMFSALAFFEPHEIENLFVEFYDSLSENAKTFADWFYVNYIRKLDDSPARNPPTFWSVYELVQKGYPKTQCGAEQSHHSLFLSCKKEFHPPLYRMISILKNQIIKSEQKIERVKLGFIEKKKTKLCAEKEKLIKDILDKKNQDRTLLDSLKAVTHALSQINRYTQLLPELPELGD